jgi:hypothetical protein
MPSRSAAAGRADAAIGGQRTLFAPSVKHAFDRWSIATQRLNPTNIFSLWNSRLVIEGHHDGLHNVEFGLDLILDGLDAAPWHARSWN